MQWLWSMGICPDISCRFCDFNVSVISNAEFSVSLLYSLTFFSVFGSQHLPVCIQFSQLLTSFFPAYINQSFPFSSFPLMSSALVMAAPNDSCSSTGTCLSHCLLLQSGGFQEKAFAFLVLCVCVWDKCFFLPYVYVFITLCVFCFISL